MGKVTVEIGIMACRDDIQRVNNVHRNVFKLRKQGVKVEPLWDEHRRGSWWNAKRFWEGMTADFGVLIQDDVTLPEAFLGNIEAIVNTVEIPTFFSGFYPTAWDGIPFQKGVRWSIGGTKIWGQCVGASRDFMQTTFLNEIWDIVKYFDEDSPRSVKEAEARGVTRKEGDDALYGAYLVATGEGLMLTNPSILQHNEWKSVEGNPTAPFGKRRVAMEVAEEVLDWKVSQDNTIKGNRDSISHYSRMWKDVEAVKRGDFRKS